MNKDLKNDYINSICVCTYNYQNNIVNSQAQYYSAISEDDAIETKSSDTYNAFGWIEGGINIVQSFQVNMNTSELTVLDINTQVPLQLPYLKQNNNIYTGYIQIQKKIDDNTYYLSGQVNTLSINNMYLSGLIYGYAVNDLLKNKIYITSNITGTVQIDNQKNFGLIQSITCLVYTTNLNSYPSSIIKDISLTNKLGRNALTYPYSLYGYNLNMQPSIYKDANTGQRRQLWKLVDTFNALTPLIISGNINTVIIENTQALIHKGAIIDNNFVNYPNYLYESPQHAYKIEVDQNQQYYIMFNQQEYILVQNIEQYKNTHNVLCGPIVTYQHTINILKKYCTANNTKLINIDNAFNEKMLIFKIF